MFKKPHIALHLRSITTKKKKVNFFLNSDWRKKKILKVETLGGMKYAAACFSAAVNYSFIF